MRANQNGALLSAACRALCCYVVVLLCKPNSAVAHGPRTAWRSWIESGAAAQKPPANESTSEIPKCYANRIAAGCGGRKSTSARATERPPTGTRRASVRMTGNTGKKVTLLLRFSLRTPTGESWAPLRFAASALTQNTHNSSSQMHQNT